ncbi:hypothetical protein KC887_08505 [Candidatus Kaiserbacteria bacterium]|nr:hypothetical protein [Candidatus Kaiserbacteria bacterium]
MNFRVQFAMAVFGSACVGILIPVFVSAAIIGEWPKILAAAAMLLLNVVWNAVQWRSLAGDVMAFKCQRRPNGWQPTSHLARTLLSRRDVVVRVGWADRWKCEDDGDCDVEVELADVGEVASLTLTRATLTRLTDEAFAKRIAETFRTAAADVDESEGFYGCA